MPKPPPTPFAPIGASKINCTGFSTSSSTKTSPACAKAMAPKTWPSSDTSPSISLEMPSNQFDRAQGSVARRQNHERLKKPASNSAENSQDGTTHTSKPSLPLKPVNLDSEPCVAAQPLRDHAGMGRSVGYLLVSKITMWLNKGILGRLAE